MPSFVRVAGKKCSMRLVEVYTEYLFRVSNHFKRHDSKSSYLLKGASVTTIFVVINFATLSAVFNARFILSQWLVSILALGVFILNWYLLSKTMEPNLSKNKVFDRIIVVYFLLSITSLFLVLEM